MGVLLALVLSPASSWAAQSDPASGTPTLTLSPAASDLKDLMDKVRPKLRAGKRAAGDFAEEFAGLDALLLKYKGETNNDVGFILVNKAMLCLQVTLDHDQGVKLLQQVVQDYPNTKASDTATRLLVSVTKQMEAEKLQTRLVAGAAFPDFQETDLLGKAYSIADLKGKVVLVDFWASWCAPCASQLPGLRDIYEKYHGSGFEILGVSMDDDKSKLSAFIAANKVTWPQFYDRKCWSGKLAEKYGVTSVPTNYLLDSQGRILGKNLSGEALEAAVSKALGGG